MSLKLFAAACFIGFSLLFLLLPLSSSAAIPLVSCPKDYVCLMPSGASISVTPPETEVSTPATSFRCVGTAYNSVVGSVDWDVLLVKKAKEKKLDPNWLCTILKKESGGKINAVGRDGECGAFQIMPFHFQNRGGGYPYKYVSNIEDCRTDLKNCCFNPRNNAEVAASLFQNLYYNTCKKDIRCAFEKYNGSGPQAVAYSQDALRINNQNKQLNPGYGIA